MMSKQQYENLLEIVDNALENDLMDDPKFDFDDFQEQILDMERDVSEAIEYYEYKAIDHYDDREDDKMIRNLERLKGMIAKVKNEYEFYDEEAELDMMFPDRHDEDFDEDSIW